MDGAKACPMTFSIIATLALPLALQAGAATTATSDAAKPASFADLTTFEATSSRCAMAFAIVQGWQGSGDPRGAAWPTMTQTDAREFFLKTMVRLIDAYDLERADIMQLVEAERARLEAQNFAPVEAMMPSCLALLEYSSSNSGR